VPGANQVHRSNAVFHFGRVRNGTAFVTSVWYTYIIFGRFQRGACSLRTALGFGSESGLISTISPLPGNYLHPIMLPPVGARSLAIPLSDFPISTF